MSADKPFTREKSRQLSKGTCKGIPKEEWKQNAG